MTRCEMYRSERLKGKTYQEVADTFGVSKQCVWEACNCDPKSRRKDVTSKCIYPNLRKWMCENGVKYSELTQMINSLSDVEVDYRKVRDVLTGRRKAANLNFSCLTKITGLSSGELFQQ